MIAIRFNQDGSLDTGFGNSGVFRSNSITEQETATDVTLAPDGKILVSGYIYDSQSSHAAIWRINP